METAENIAKSCNLIQESFTVLRYEPPEVLETNFIVNTLKKLVAEANQLSEEGKPKGLLVEGSDLTPIIANE